MSPAAQPVAGLFLITNIFYAVDKKQLFYIGRIDNHILDIAN